MDKLCCRQNSQAPRAPPYRRHRRRRGEPGCAPADKLEFERTVEYRRVLSGLAAIFATSAYVGPLPNAEGGVEVEELSAEGFLQTDEAAVATGVEVD